MERLRVGIVLFEGFEELDVVGPFETLTKVNWVKEGALEVFTVAERAGIIKAYNGLKVVADYDFEGCPPLDIMVVPGGRGRLKEMHNQRLLDFLREKAEGCQWITSVCTGAFILAEAGILKGKMGTTHWYSMDELRGRGDVIVRDERVVRDGNVITSAGVSAGIDMALDLAETIFGDGSGNFAQEVARLMEYNYIRPTERLAAGADDSPKQ